MKKLLLFALVLSLAMGTAIAKQKGGPKSPPGQRGNPIERLTDQLGLDEDQVAAVTVIFDEAKALRDVEKDAFKEIMCDIREDTHTQLYAVLTPEQQALLDELQQKRADARKAFMETHPEHDFRGHHGLECDD